MTVRRRHVMPFGAAVTGHEQVTFRLWAPAASTIELCLEARDGEHMLPMAAQTDGWFELEHNGAAPPVRYRYRIDGKLRVPDPASRYNPLDVHGASEVVDPLAFEWTDADWRGRPWSEAVIYELHVGTFTDEGTFRGVESRLDYLAELGVTAVELMPVADFPGRYGWGYDGVLAFAPEAAYGPPEDLKRLVQAAHGRGLMVLLDVVYNHFGPEGNYLHTYAPQFFTGRHHTPWGAAINFDGPQSRAVRDFFIHNALYWLEEFHLDGLRLDAVHAICDESVPDILTELAEAVRRGPGRSRHVHLVLENDLNHARRLERNDDGSPRHYDAQWNDDIHHAFHVLLTGETDGYYSDYCRDPVSLAGRCLVEGYAYQGEASAFRQGKLRGEPSTSLPATAFVSFLQNHDQIGNRAFGERLMQLATSEALAAAAAVILLAPSPPLIFMGEEFGAATPFLFFSDLGPELNAAVSEGRRREFARFARFGDPAVVAAMPDPCAAETFSRSKLAWSAAGDPPHLKWLTYYRRLLGLRHRDIVPLLDDLHGRGHSYRKTGERSLCVRWRVGDAGELVLLANFGDRPGDVRSDAPRALNGRLIFATEGALDAVMAAGMLPPWSVVWRFRPASSEQ
ncbi:MAG TPA: malto-oligosyltrehalose trehalohydrolase [Burkholderiales bacterium]|nr:malto-oligosyltrehalose trehalohydrolase [Burkholderiales bacterium]